MSIIDPGILPVPADPEQVAQLEAIFHNESRAVLLNTVLRNQLARDTPPSNFAGNGPPFNFGPARHKPPAPSHAIRRIR